MKKILIVDDNTQILSMLQTLLSEHGYGVVAAANGAEALEKARSEPPDMIIADILMPVMDGFQLCREWKLDGRLKNVPFVFCTATYTDPKDEEFALGLGAERFIVKPMKPEAFLGILKEVFEAQKAGRLAAPCEPQHDETVYFREYNEVLIRKLEAKMVQIEKDKRCLEGEVAANILTEEAMRESEEKYRALIETTNTGYVILDLTGKVLDANDEYARLTGHERRDEILGQSVVEWTAAYDRERNAMAVEECVRQGFIRNFELDYAVHQGQTISVEITATLITTKNGLQILTLCRDITEKKQAEEQMLSLQAQLQQSQKMEAIGRLAGGVAHDFNNLLTVISVQSQLALRGLREGNPLKEKLKDIELAAEQAGNLTRHLLAFSRRQILEPRVVDLNSTLEDMEKMLGRVIGEDIELKTVLSEKLGMVKVDPGQMEQVVMNLVVNAKDAMPQGGKLFLETANAELDEEYTRFHAGMIPGAYVMLSVSDSGVGMTREVQEQIFDPFFTTKEKGKGTGLGLSTVYGIMKQSGGDIYVYSEVGKGTTFKLYLPRVFEPLEEFKKGVPVEKIPQGNETILVVEDDGSVRKIVVDLLRVQGYKVLEATGGEEALIIFEKGKNPIHLILTDIVMPHMNGPQVIERLRQVRKDFKVLYMTGYTDEAIVQHGVVDKTINLIHKPFSIEKLARKVREVLDKN